MQTLKLKKKSWHYWLATEFGNYKDHDTSVGFCGYCFEVAWGMGMLAIVAYFVGILGFALYDGGQYALLWSLNRFFHTSFKLHITEGGAVLSSVIVGFAALVGMIFAIVTLNDRYEDSKPYKASKSFIVNAFRTFRSKTCTKVEFE